MHLQDSHYQVLRAALVPVATQKIATGSECAGPELQVL